jgi:AbrB family looped-hinge helix DNA binding protein
MTVTVSSKGQVTLPAEIRRRLGITAGTKLDFVIRGDDQLEVIKLGGSVRDLKGALGPPVRKLTIEEMDAAIAAGAARVP